MSSLGSTSLTLRAVLKSASSRAALGAPAHQVSGLSPAAKALFVATAAADSPAVVVVPSDGEIEAAVADIRFFLAAIEALPDQDVRGGVLPFPSHEVDPYRCLAPHFDIASARAAALHHLARAEARVVVASVGALFPRVSPPERLMAASTELAKGGEVSPTWLGDLLADAGFNREDPVDQHGEFCVRGGVVDFFPAGDAQPIRVEFLGDTIESIRRYDPSTQRSVAPLDKVTTLPLRELFEMAPEADSLAPTVESRSSSFFEFATRTQRLRVFVSEMDEAMTRASKLIEQVHASYDEVVVRDGHATPPEQLWVEIAQVERWLAPATRLEQLEVTPAAGAPAKDSLHIACQPAVEFRGRLSDWIADIRRARERRETVLFVAATAGRAERTLELLAEHDLRGVSVDQTDESPSVALLVATGQLSRGFRLPAAGLQIYAETDVFEEERRVHERRKSTARTFLSDFRDLKVGDLVVHVDHGVGVFKGLSQISVGSDLQEFMELGYAGQDKLFVPVEYLDLVEKYTGAAKAALDRLGGTTWERAKTKVRRAMRDMAEELLKLYAARKSVSGHPFGADTHWQEEFEGAFEYELTSDQQSAVADIKRDMEAPTPMDRLLCGDVGYGKTEVALRAAFKAVMDGKQVAFLAPTTVLAFQHYKTLNDRFAAFPVRIEMVSRFRSRAEQKPILEDLSSGRIEIIVGTHRLLSKDVQFKDLGLLIVDEEQRFGVAHKERIKQLRRRVDVLTMTATPIPRTLNMSLVGIRDMSVIETPPKDRLSIQTNVVKFDTEIIRRAIRNELERSGQVYFVHNRVESIDSVADMVLRIVPEARVAVAHGQSSEEALERSMVDFISHKYDVLLATTIIENGLDIPNVNTIVVNHADRYGLAQLYQLRGRVGRSDRRAYAYLLVPPQNTLSPVARKRLAAIKEFSDLGSGFRVAALDLEIRGAGNLLGGEQSGHIEAIGFDMYVKLLEQTVRELKGEEVEDEARAAVNLKLDLRLDDTYIPDMNQRLAVYRRVAAARSEETITRLLEEMVDRYGPMPSSLLNLAEYGRIRIMADRIGLESIDRETHTVVLKFRAEARVDPAHLIRLVQARHDVTLTPPAVLRMDLREALVREASGPGSWWTLRATSGGVSPGFAKKDLVPTDRVDRHGEEGIFSRVAELLTELGGDAGRTTSASGGHDRND